MNEEIKRLSMEDFNRICLDCGLVPNEAKNKEYNDEASYFNLVHPLAKEPIEVAYYEDFIDDDDTYLYIGAHTGSILGKNFCQTSTNYLRIEESVVRKEIETVKKLLDEEFEARKNTKVPLKEFVNFLAHSRINITKPVVELSVPFHEFLDRLGTNPVLKIDVTKE